MNATTEIQVALVGRILSKTRDQVIEEAVTLFCRSIAGNREKGSVKAMDAAEAADVRKRLRSPGSPESRIVKFVKAHQSVTPAQVFAHMVGTKQSNVRQRIALLEQVGVLQMTGHTQNRKITVNPGRG